MHKCLYTTPGAKDIPNQQYKFFFRTFHNDMPQEQIQWWAMSAVFNRSIKMKSILDLRHIENFVPLHQVVTLKGTRKIKKLSPIIANLIFIHTDKETIKSLKGEFEYLQYLTNKDGEKRTPIIVPERQMTDFITVAGSQEEKLIYLDSAELNLQQGCKVRITSGTFAGVEGQFMKVKGARDRRVVVAIDGVAAVATTSIPPQFIEPIE